MQRQEFIEQIAELSARIKRIERWQDQWGSRNRRVATLRTDDIYADEVRASEGYLVAVGRGLCANRHVEFNPISRSYPVGETLLTTIDPGAEYHSLLPLWWQAPAKSGDVETVVRFTFSDGTELDRRNIGAVVLEEWHPTTFLFFKDGVTCTQLSFIADNQGTAQSQDLGTFKFQGWQF